jgi:hypothetical protein
MTLAHPTQDYIYTRIHGKAASREKRIDGLQVNICTNSGPFDLDFLAKSLPRQYVRTEPTLS